MITFAPNDHCRPMAITNDQLSTIYRLSGGNDVEVIGHEPSPIVEVIVDDMRYHVDECGTIGLTERATVVDQDWDWEPVLSTEPELGEVFKDGTVTVRLIGEPGKTMGHESADTTPGLQEFYVTALTALIDRISVGRFDDMWDDFISDEGGITPDLYCNVSFGG